MGRHIRCKSRQHSGTICDDPRQVGSPLLSPVYLSNLLLKWQKCSQCFIVHLGLPLHVFKLHFCPLHPFLLLLLRQHILKLKLKFVTTPQHILFILWSSSSRAVCRARYSRDESCCAHQCHISHCSIMLPVDNMAAGLKQDHDQAPLGGDWPVK